MWLFLAFIALASIGYFTGVTAVTKKRTPTQNSLSVVFMIFIALLFWAPQHSWNEEHKIDQNYIAKCEQMGKLLPRCDYREVILIVSDAERVRMNEIADTSAFQNIFQVKNASCKKGLFLLKQNPNELFWVSGVDIQNRKMVVVKLVSDHKIGFTLFKPQGLFEEWPLTDFVNNNAIDLSESVSSSESSLPTRSRRNLLIAPPSPLCVSPPSEQK